MTTVTKEVRVVPDAAVTPTALRSKKRTYTGCVYDADGFVVDISQRSNDGDVRWHRDDPPTLRRFKAARTIEGRSVYLGHYSGHYGHFLMETLARFWILEDGAAFDTYIFQPFVHEMPRVREFGPASASFACFGIDPERVVFADEPLRVTELTVPSSLCVINVAAHPDQAAVYRRIAACCAEGATDDSAERLYVSRRSFDGFRPVTNEDEVEEAFAALGFTVVHPQQMRFADQVTAFHRASVIAGFAGSGMHNSVFMREGTTAISIGHLRRLRPETPVPNQLICDGLAGVRSVFVPFEGELTDERTREGLIDVGRLRESVEAHL